MNPVTLIIPIGALLIVLLVGWIGSRLFGEKKSNTRRSFQKTDGQLPAPGQAMIDRIDPMRFDVRLRVVQAILAPVLIGVGYLTVRLSYPELIGSQGVLVMIVAAVMVEAILLSRYRLAQNDFKKTLLGYKAKQATAKALLPFEAQGDVVCHEFYKDHLFVDHILVGNKGIFAIQTHPRSARPKNAEGHDNMVTYDGREIFFPKGEDGGVLTRACESAELLSSWLSDELNSPVACRAVVSMPGWQVKRTSADGIPVVSPHQFESLFAHIPARPLSSQQIETIVELIKATYGLE